MKKINYCCERLKDMYETIDYKHKILVYTQEFDETEWYIRGLGHLYFCPFCGSNISGQGFGKKVEPFKRE